MILAIDVGNKRFGIAKYEKNIDIVLPVGIFDKKGIYEFLTSVESKIEKLVIGLPVSMSGRYSSQTAKVVEFSWNLKKKFDIKEIFFYDERLTTKIFYSQFKGLKKHSELRKEIDKNSAVLILQNFLDSPQLAKKLEEKEIKRIPKELKGKVLIFDIAVENFPKNAHFYITDPWLFWWYSKRKIKSTTKCEDLENQYDFLVIEKGKKFDCEKIIYNERLCL